MSKSTTRKKVASPKTEKVPAAYAKTSPATPAVEVDKYNSSKFQSTKEADLDTQLLGTEDGIIKLFTDSIKDIYWAENHLVKALPIMAKAASSKTLKNAITEHREQTKIHAGRLEQIFEKLAIKKEAKKCDAMEGLTKEGEEMVEMTDRDTPARDLGIIMASRKVEHYEMAAYSGLVKLADRLGYPEISALLSETLEEEEEANNILSDIADDNIVLNGE
ncbi:MAG: hypothetical protein JWM28_1374 [Chitinophagaceae bacterium]|nr:hypothetical protein [Chitinophagaceae bacterium]